MQSSCLSGAPITETSVHSFVSSIIRLSCINTESSRASCRKSSPQVEPVKTSSGNTSSLTPCLSASRIESIILSALYFVSASLILGEQAATLINPSFIFASYSALYALFHGQRKYALNSKSPQAHACGLLCDYLKAPCFRSFSGTE